MSGCAYIVVYEGRAHDPDAFERYYLEHHLPIIRTWPGIRDVEVSRGVSAGLDPKADDAGFFLMARFAFDSVDALSVALDSPERARARADRDNFPAFEGQVRHQVVEVIEHS